jgi:hypothetical protein
MGRPSKLSQPQVIEIGRRMAAGEATRALAREFRVGEATLRRIFSAQAPIIQDVARRLSTAELDLSRLPVTAQKSARTLADQMVAVGSHLWNGAENGAKTFEILTSKAVRRAEALGEDFTEDGEGREELKIINALNTAGNEAIKTAVALVNANKPKDQPTDDQGIAFRVIRE